MKRMLGGVVACALVLSGCAKSPPLDVPVFTPSPISAPSVGPTPTPDQAELSAMAEATYRTFFAEWKRLEHEGGADEPTAIMEANATGRYLDDVMALLREQKRRSDYRIIESATTTRVTAAPGKSIDQSDPRLSLDVCEDGSAGRYSIDGVEHRGYIVEGTVYLRFIEGKPKLVAGTTQRVEQCTI